MREHLRKERVRWLDSSGLQGVFNPDTFSFALRRERERADRYARKFSLIVLRLSVNCNDSCEDQILHFIAEKMRIIDSIGWLDSRRLGVLLPDTSADESVEFLEELAPVISDDAVVAGIAVHTYPDSSRSDEAVEKAVAGGRTATFVAESGEDFSSFWADIFCSSPGLLWRWLERGAAGGMLLILSPLLLLFALAIKMSSPGPVLFVQERIGHQGKRFRCYKFRTMHPHSETRNHEEYFSYLVKSGVPMRKLDSQGDPRIFPVGRLLRASSLDELPQLINMFKGEMRLVGPRPSTPHEFAQFLPWQRRRVDAIPGLTGLWQVSGKNQTTFAEMIRFDLRYVREQSFLFDVRIILKTFPVLIGLFLEEHHAPGIAKGPVDVERTSASLCCFTKPKGRTDK